MFNIGPGELMAILAVALIVLGPTRLPEAVRTVGRVVGELRRISSGFQDELRNAFDDGDVIDQLEKGPSAKPATATGDADSDAEAAAQAAAEAEAEPVDTAAMGVAEVPPSTVPLDGAEDLVDDDLLHDGDVLDDERFDVTGGAETDVDTGPGASAPRPGTEDPPETDQRAAS